MITSDEYEVMKAFALSMSYDFQELLIDCRFSYDSLVSLRNQLLVRKLKIESRKIDILMREKLISYVVSSDPKYHKSLLQISQEMSTSSYKLAKSFLDIYFSKPIAISTFLDDPVSVIPLNHELRKDLLNCISSDPVCSLESTLIAECYGREYEEILISNLNTLHLCFETEADLRAKGRSKTPDILLAIPMAVFLPSQLYTPMTTNNHTDHNNSTQSNELMMEPHAVNWIDSKAIFADEETLREHLAQFKAYSNRYAAAIPLPFFIYFFNSF